MELENTNYKNPFIRFFSKIRYLWLKILDSKLYTFLLLSFIMLAVLVFVMALPAYFNSFMNVASDDIIQYYPYAGGLFEKLKSGTLSLYDKNLLLGASVFNTLYYVPYDIFTFIAFLFSYIIPGEIAMAGCNLLRVIVGAMIFYYVLSRHMSYKVAFFASLIFFISGMTEAYYIFPVYLGILTYVPLGMLIVDLCVEKKGIWYLLIPIYVAIVVFYDFYIAYMLMAFFCIYFVVKCHIDNKFSLIGKNSIFINGKFWLRFLEFMGMVFLGLAISMFVLMPGAFYILNESNRSDLSNTNESIWFFSKKIGDETVVSWRHYFTQLINLFMPNEPHRFCLVDAGDYVREHATLYLTSGGLIYFVYFFFIRGKRENRLKFWVILFNILLLIPLFSIIFGLNSSPYVRWFFIPYMLNIYAMAIGMNNMEFKLGNKFLLRLVPLVILSVGVGMIMYVLINDPEIFIHYHATDELFNPLLIIALVFNVLYVLLLLFSLCIKFLRNHSELSIILFKIILFFEILFAGAMIFINTGNSNSWYITAKKSMEGEMAHLKELGYNEEDGYRVNIYTNYGRNTVNTNVIFGANFGRYFQSFYPVNINPLFSNIYMDYDTGWSRNFVYGYTLTNGAIFNTKYIVTNENINLPSKYYEKSTYNEEDYYVLKNDLPFIVYDKGYTTPSSLGGFERQVSLLEYAYISIPTNSLEELKEKNDKYGQLLYDSYGAITDAKFELQKASDVTKYVNRYVKKVYISSDVIEYDTYRVYDMTKTSVKNTIEDMDVLYVWPNSSELRKEENVYMYLREKNPDNPEPVDTSDKYGQLHQMHYNETYLGGYTPTQLLVEYKKTEYSSGLDLYAYKYDLYDDFLSKQDTFTDKYFSLDGDTMKVKCTMPNKDKTRIIKTGFAYSKDWVIIDSDYSLVAVDGAFLGILVPEGNDKVDVTIKFKPTGYYEGLSISLAGTSIYIAICSFSLGVIAIRKKRVEML